MILPVQITFRNMESSPAVEARIRAEAAKAQNLLRPIDQLPRDGRNSASASSAQNAFDSLLIDTPVSFVEQPASAACKPVT
jgi:hypothetical protein